jgi:hypothetical protein
MHDDADTAGEFEHVGFFRRYRHFLRHRLSQATEVDHYYNLVRTHMVIDP